MTSDEFRAWRRRMEYSRPQAAAALGVHLSTIINYEVGKRRDGARIVRIPRAVALACAAIESGLATRKNA